MSQRSLSYMKIVFFISKLSLLTRNTIRWGMVRSKALDWVNELFVTYLIRKHNRIWCRYIRIYENIVNNPPTPCAESVNFLNNQVNIVSHALLPGVPATVSAINIDYAEQRVSCHSRSSTTSTISVLLIVIGISCVSGIKLITPRRQTILH